MDRNSKARWKGDWDRPQPSEILKKYIKRGVFFHMSDLGPGSVNTDRFGINPKQQWDTPFGIYGYPLNNTYYKKLITGDLPFREDAPWVHVFTVDLQKCLSASKYTPQDLGRDLELLRQFGMEEEVILTARKSARVQTPAGIIWNVTRVAAKGSITKWSKLFRRLGYQSFWDSKCQGIIHPNEKCQAVVFSTGAAKRLNVVPNPFISDKYTSMGFKPSTTSLHKALKGWVKDGRDEYYRTTYIRDVGLVRYEVDLEKEYFTLYMRAPKLGIEDWVNSKGELKKEFIPLLMLRSLNSIIAKTKSKLTPKVWEFRTLKAIPISLSPLNRIILLNRVIFSRIVEVATATGYYILIETTLGVIVAIDAASPKVVNSQGKVITVYNIAKIEDIMFYARRSQAKAKIQQIHEEESRILEEKFS